MDRACRSDSLMTLSAAEQAGWEVVDNKMGIYRPLLRRRYDLS